MTTSFPPISYPGKPVPPFTAEPPRNPFPGFFPDMWKNIKGKPYVTVSSKGLANGLSEYFNDGADFGPDSLQADGSLTQTVGIYEAWMYSINTAIPAPTGGGAAFMTPLKILSGMYIVEEPTTLPLTNSTGQHIANPTILGDSSMAPFIMSAHQGGYTFTIPAMGATNYRIENIQPCTPSQFPYAPPGYTSPPTPDGFLKIDASTNTSSINGWIFEGYNIDISAGGWSETALYINGAYSIILYNLEGYGGGTTYGNAFLTAGGVIILDSSNFGANNPSIALGGYNITTSTTTYIGSPSIFLINCYSDNGAPVPPILVVDGGIGYMIQKPFVAPLQYSSSLVQPTHGGSVEIDGGVWIPTSDNNYSLLYFLAATSGIIGMSYAKIRITIANTSSTNPANLITGGGATISWTNIEFEYYPNGGNEQYFNLPMYGANPIQLPTTTPTEVNGTTAGQVLIKPTKYDIYYKKMIYYFEGYENDTTTDQAINHWAPFSTIVAITANTTGLTITTTQTGITITAPDSTTTYSGIVIVEGY